MKFLKKCLVYSLIIGELFSTTSVYALTKEESVYVKLNQDGTKKSMTISEHLFDYSGNKINDKSSLMDIKNINGDEKFTKNGNNIVWESNGNDIYYQGTSDKELPVSMSVTYYLDNKEMDVNDMLGKKGHVKIVLSYQNNLSKNVNINGKIEKIYAPFMIVTTSILNNSDHQNIKVTNGKVVDNGVTSIVVCLTSPGLYESLKVNELKNLNKVEISYDTESFELNSIYSVASSNMFDNDLDLFGNINDLYKKINLLQSNMNEIVEASKKLSEGSNTMSDGIGLLNGKIEELTKKYNYYRNQDKETLKEELIRIIEENIKKIIPSLEEDIANETSKIVKENKETLEKSIIEYTKKNTKLVLDNEVKKIVNNIDVNSLLEKVMNSNLANVLTKDEEVKKLTELLKGEINKELNSIISNSLNEIIKNINIKMSEEESKAYIENIANKYGITYEQAKGIVGDVQQDTINGVKKSMISMDIPGKIISTLNDKEYVNNLVNNYVNEINTKLNEYLKDNSAISEYANSLKEKILDAIKKDLSNDELFMNIDVKKYLEGMVDEIVNNTSHDLAGRYTEEYFTKIVGNVMQKEFSDENVDSKLREILKKYEKDIMDKVDLLDTTINTLSESVNKLNNGSKELSSGMKALSDGLVKYNKEGINKINNIVNVDVKSLQKRLESVIDLSKEYKTLDDINNGTKGKSKIIFMIDSLSKPVIEKEIEETVPENKTLWDKIKGLFE